MSTVVEQIVTPYHQTDRFSLYEGDCRSVLPVFADWLFDSIVCDPPYELGFMGKGWDRSGIAYDLNVWRECLRVLKPGGHLLAFGGSRTYHRLACAIEDAGFEIRDQIQWLYGSGFPKSLDVSKAIDAAQGAERSGTGDVVRAGCRAARNGGELVGSQTVEEAKWKELTAPATEAARQWNGWGSALKPAHEPIVLARKPLIGTVAENVLRHGTGGLNIDGCRIETNGEDLGDPARFLSSDKSLHDGWQRPHKANPDLMSARADERFERTANLGRWPANVIHDGSDEVLAAFPDSEGQQGRLSGNEPSGTFSLVSSGPLTRFAFEPRNDSGSAARFFYCAKSSQEDRNEGLDGVEVKQQDESRKEGNPGGNNPRNRGLSLRANHHPTVKPTDLMRYLCRLITPPGGIVLDPFCGSGSTGKAAMLEGFKFVGIELNADYCQLAQRRIKAVTRQGLLFT